MQNRKACLSVLMEKYALFEMQTLLYPIMSDGRLVFAPP